MKKLIALLAVALPLMGQAQPPEGQDWWACQSVASGGLSYSDKKWRTTKFEHDYRFILIADGDDMSNESIAKVMDTEPEDLICAPKTGLGQFFCLVSYTGESFGFDPSSGTGAIAKILGASMDMGEGNEYRDTIDVTAFECAKG